MATELGVTIKSSSNYDKLSQAFARELTQRKCEYVNYESATDYVVDCIQRAHHKVHAKSALGRYQQVDKMDLQVSCTFCMSKYRPREYKRTLQCGHTFHKRCIDMYILNYNAKNCPCCRKYIF